MQAITSRGPALSLLFVGIAAAPSRTRKMPLVDLACLLRRQVLAGGEQSRCIRTTHSYTIIHASSDLYAAAHCQ